MRGRGRVEEERQVGDEAFLELLDLVLDDGQVREEELVEVFVGQGGCVGQWLRLFGEG